MVNRRVLLLGLLAWPALAGAPLTVAAAANLKPALDELAPAFTAATRVEVRTTFAATGALYAQITNGAPFDVFLAADVETPSRLAADGLALDPPRAYATGVLVLWVPSSSGLIPDAGLALVATPAVKRLAIGNPDVAPYGKAAREALAAAGLLEKVKDRLVLGQSVAQAAQFAHTGNAQAALVPLSMALSPPLSTDGKAWEVPSRLHAPLLQAVVIPRGTRRPEDARRFVEFLLGPQGQAVLARHGYRLPR